MKARRTEVLLVEDDADLALGLTDALELAGYSVKAIATGPAGLVEALSGRPSLLILDEMLPGRSGFEVLAELRERGSPLPVLMLTARGQEADKVRGLKLGADDYVTKPFGMMELLARVEALLRRASERGAPARLDAGAFIVDFRARRAWRGSRAVDLTPREFQILETLAARRGEAVSRDDLVARIWGTAEDVVVSTRTVDQHVAGLRRKLEAGGASIIETVYGHGYRLAP